MHYLFKNKILKISLLFLTFFNINTTLPANNRNLIIGGVLTAGIIYGIYKYFNSDSYNQKIIENASLSVMSCQNFIVAILVLEREFDLKTMDDIQKKYAVGRITESLTYELAPSITSIGFNVYISNLTNCIRNIKDNKKSLEAILNKLKTKNDEQYNKALNVIKSMEDMLPKLEFLYSYLDVHRGYFKLYETGLKTNNDFERDIEILLSNIEPFVVDCLKRNIRTKYFDAPYPFLEYVESITKDINRIQNNLALLTYKYPTLIKEMDRLREKLITIRNFIVVDQEYLNEKRKFDEDKERKEKNRIELELKKREIEIREARLKQERDLKEREIAAKERANQNQLVLNAINAGRPVTPPVHIHIPAQVRAQ